MKINRRELINALEIVRPGLSSKEMIEQSTSFAFIHGKIVTYNDEISISHPVKNLDITGAIKAEELYKLLGKLTEEELEIQIIESEVIIQSGRAKAGFHLQEKITLPLIDTKKLSTWNELPADFSTAMQFCLFSCSNDMSRPILTCIHLRKEGIVEASDNYRITQYEIGEVLPFDDILIPSKTVEQLLRYKIKEVSSSSGWLHFRTKDKTIFSCRTIEGTYPDITPVLQKQGKKIIFPKKIGTVLERASVFSKKEVLLGQTVTIQLENKKACIQSKGEYGWFEEKINARYSGESITFHVNPIALQEMCVKLQTSFITEGKIQFAGENWKHAIALQRV